MEGQKLYCIGDIEEVQTVGGEDCDLSHTHSLLHWFSFL
jgi:hypothetical protein